MRCRMSDLRLRGIPLFFDRNVLKIGGVQNMPVELMPPLQRPTKFWLSEISFNKRPIRVYLFDYHLSKINFTEYNY